MVTEYILKRKNSAHYTNEEDLEEPSENFIDFNGKKILFWQKYGGGGRYYVIVAGYVVSKEYITKEGARAIKCEAIEKNKENELETLLYSQGFKGPININ